MIIIITIIKKDNISHNTKPSSAICSAIEPTDDSDVPPAGWARQRGADEKSGLVIGGHCH